MLVSRLIGNERKMVGSLEMAVRTCSSGPHCPNAQSPLLYFQYLYRIHHHRSFGAVARTTRGFDNLIHHVHTFDYLAENRVFVVQPVRGSHGDEELRAVGARTGVGHGEAAGLIERKVLGELVLKVVARSARAGAKWATALNHKIRNDAVETQAVIIGPLGALTRFRI